MIAVPLSTARPRLEVRAEAHHLWSDGQIDQSPQLVLGRRNDAGPLPCSLAGHPRHIRLGHASTGIPKIHEGFPLQSTIRYPALITSLRFATGSARPGRPVSVGLRPRDQSLLPVQSVVHDRGVRLASGRRLTNPENGRPGGLPGFVLHGTPGSRFRCEPHVEDSKGKGDSIPELLPTGLRRVGPGPGQVNRRGSDRCRREGQARAAILRSSP